MLLPAGATCHDMGVSIALKSGFSIENSPPGYLVRGGAKARWSILAGGGYCERAWVHDLDRNGQPDLLISFGTMGNGMAPPRRLVAVMIDDSGLPVPWQVLLYQTEDENGPFALVDFNQDGRAEVLRDTYGVSDQGDYAYWIWSLYEARGALWHSVHTPLGALRFPLFSKFTFAPHDLPSWFLPGREPAVLDDANAAFGEPAVQIVSRLAASVGDVQRRRGEGLASYYTRWTFLSWPKLKLSDGRACALRNYVELLWDDGRVRRWYYGGGHEEKSLIDRALRERWHVHAATSTEKGHCFVPGLWLKRGPAPQR